MNQLGLRRQEFVRNDLIGVVDGPRDLRYERGNLEGSKEGE